MTLNRLKALLLIFFIALALPTSVLVYQAYGQLKWEAFHQHQRLARELALRIDARFVELIRREENRVFEDYVFPNVSGDDAAEILQRTPLSSFPLLDKTPGLVGYFQVDPQGRLQTPTLPPSDAERYGISALELDQRVLLENRIREILGENRLVGKIGLIADAPLAEPEQVQSPRAARIKKDRGFEAEEPIAYARSSPAAEEIDSSLNGQAVFDELKRKRNTAILDLDSFASSERVEDLKLEDSYQVATQKAREILQKSTQEKRSRNDTSRDKEHQLRSTQLRAEDDAALTAKIDVLASSPAIAKSAPATRIRTFESELGALEFSLLDSGHFVLFRRAWHDNQRFVQGLLFEPKLFIDSLIASAFAESTLSSASKLIVAYQGNVVKSFDAGVSAEYTAVSRDTVSELLYQIRLVAPFSDIELIFSLAQLPLGAGARVVGWTALILGLVLIGGVVMLFQLGARQLALNQQQQDFVSAVSHELKTPLTSIRMYGEMLREGWVDEARKRSYYDFIFNESERLSRLINNILQLARMKRNEQAPCREMTKVGAVLEDNRSRLESQLENAGFAFDFDCTDAAKQASINIDCDWFTQVLINLVDNAIKFSRDAGQKRVCLACRISSDDRVVISVRDFGPGVAKDQMRKIFKLFYRSENELTRETIGTGIGLALVAQLVGAMGGEVDLVNCEPGVEFRLMFPLGSRA